MPSALLRVLEQGVRGRLRRQALLASLGRAYDGVGERGVDEGVLEQPEPELFPQQTTRGGVNTCLADLAGLHQADQDLGTALASELVDARVHGFQEALLVAEVLDAPAGVVENAPVAADDSVVAELVPQQVGDDGLVEAEADLLVLGADGHAVVGHHLRDSSGDDGLEWFEVQVEVPSGVDLFPAVGEVRVLAVLLRAPSGEVLGHRGHRVRAYLLALQAADVGDTEA